MPTYQYACENCGHRFDTRQRFNDAPLTICPQCGAPIHRVINPVGIIFKGPGFYVTDNKSGNNTHDNGNAQKAKTNGDKNGTLKKPPSETPSEAKTKTPAASNE